MPAAVIGRESVSLTAVAVERSIFVIVVPVGIKPFVPVPSVTAMPMARAADSFDWSAVRVIVLDAAVSATPAIGSAAFFVKMPKASTRSTRKGPNAALPVSTRRPSLPDTTVALMLSEARLRRVRSAAIAVSTRVFSCDCVENAEV